MPPEMDRDWFNAQEKLDAPMSNRTFVEEMVKLREALSRPSSPTAKAPKEYGKGGSRVTIRLSPEACKRLDGLCKAGNVSASSAIDSLILKA
jgi:hypothetical protein